MAKFYKYVWNITSDRGSYIDVCENHEEYENRQGTDTVRWFKGFGKCYRRDCGNYTKFYTSCNSSFHEEHFYNSLEELLKGENLGLSELKPGINQNQKSFGEKANIIIDKNGINKGLMSYDELVASFYAGEYIHLWGYFSSTTARHQDAYLFPSYMKYSFQSDIDKLNKKVIETSPTFWFA